MPHAQLDAGLIFSGKPSGTMISGYDEPSTYTPTVNLNYIFHDSSRAALHEMLQRIFPVTSTNN